MVVLAQGLPEAAAIGRCDALEVPLPHHVDVSIALLGCPHNMEAGFLQSGCSERKSKEEAPMPFMF